jgi:two-component system NtrC family sensor kinase
MYHYRRFANKCLDSWQHILIELDKAHQQLQLYTANLGISERRYRELFENAHDAVWEHDLEGNITAANYTVELLSGYNRNELIGKNVKTLLTEDSLKLAGSIRYNLFAGEQFEQPYEQYLLRKDGTVAILQLTTNLIIENEQPKGFLHIARDVTKEKKIQDTLNKAYQELRESNQQLKESQERLLQAEKLTSLGQMAASVAHEVNNPLSGILVYTQLLIKKLAADNMPKETALEYLTKMESETVRATKIILSLLDFARQSPPAFRNVDVNEVITQSFDLASHTARLQHIQVTKELDSALPRITADFDQLQQVCTNLILNAVQAMPTGGKLIIRTSVESKYIKIEVKDTGHGISPENMRRLFTPFFTTKREVKGVGLGLAVAYGIVQRHKGKIDVQSTRGEGATFTVLLPISSDETS